MMHHAHPSKGFTLVETLIAISILAVAVVGPFVAIQSALVASYAARDQVIASMLAQEAIEYVRAVRDENYIYMVANPASSRTWFTGLDSTGGVDCVDPNPADATPRRCIVDVIQNIAPSSNKVALCGNASGSGTCPVLRRSPTTYLYTQDTSYPATPFTRSITLERLASGREMRVTAVVTWSSGHRSYTITLTEILSAWL
jgi:prepilin-type N-terminal cleavage/methylation domain-containing protein